MATAETDSADADTTEDVEEKFPWVGQTPTTRLRGERKGIIYSDRLDDSVAQNDTSFGVIIEGPEVVNGELWVNQQKPEGKTTAEGTADDEPRPTDYRIADSDDSDTTIANGALVTGENGPNTYEETDGFEEDTIIVWYNGLSGQRISRVLDFNGRPFARWTADPYLVKGLYQTADGWREAKGSERGEMAKNGKAPRVARAPILRDRVVVEENDEGDTESVELLAEDDFEGGDTLFDLSRAANGRGYRAHVFDAEAYADEVGDVTAEIPRNDAGYVKDDIESELDMPYTAAADDVLEQAGYAMHMYTGDGWQDEPTEWQPQTTAEVSSFGVSVDSGGDDEETDGLTAEEEQFVTEVVDELKGTGMTPEEAFDGGLSGLVGKFSDQFDRSPDVDDLREAVYTDVAHLDPTTLDD